MDKIYKFDYVTGEYEIKIEGTLEYLYDELDRLLDYYRNGMEAINYNDIDSVIEELVDEGFEVKVTRSDQ